MAQPVVGIVGLKALNKDHNRLADDVKGPLFKAIAQAGYDAVQPIVAATKAALPSGSRTNGRLAGTVRASRTRTGGAVRLGPAGRPPATPPTNRPGRSCRPAATCSRPPGISRPGPPRTTPRPSPGCSRR